MEVEPQKKSSDTGRSSPNGRNTHAEKLTLTNLKFLGCLVFIFSTATKKILFRIGSIFKKPSYFAHL